MPTEIPSFAGNRPTGGGQIKDTRNFNIDLGDWLLGNKWETMYFGIVNTGSDKISFPEIFNSNTDSTIADATGTSFTKDFNEDFDIKISGDRLIGGDFLSSVKWINGSDGGEVTESYVILKVVHYDGTTETTLGSARTTTATGNDETKTETIQGTLTKKSFKSGDILRITLEGWIKTSDPAQAPNKITVFHDGNNQWAKIPFINLDEY